MQMKVLFIVFRSSTTRPAPTRPSMSIGKTLHSKVVSLLQSFDRVDYKKYPSLANPNLHYYQLTMNPGDCLFIPALWIHQVRSTHRNVAVNYWLDHQRVKNAQIDPQICTNVDPMDFVTLESIHWPTVANNIEQLKDFMLDLVDDDATSFKQWTREFSKVKFDDDRSADSDLEIRRNSLLIFNRTFKRSVGSLR